MDQLGNGSSNRVPAAGFRPLAALAAVLALGLPPASGGLRAEVSPAMFEPVSGPGSPDAGDEPDELALKTDRHQRMTVQVFVAGAGPYDFLVDTGADRTAISHELASRLRLERGADAQLHTVSGQGPVGTTMIPRLQVSSRDVDVPDAPLLPSNKIGADGILGTDVLRSRRVMFDFGENRMSVEVDREVEVVEDGTIVVRGRLRTGRLILSRAAADGHDVALVIDTGSEVTIGNEPLRRRLAKRRMLKHLGQIELESVTGEKVLGQLMFLDRLKIGGAELTNLAVVFADSHAFRKLRLDRRPALLLGMNAMRAFERVTIDFAGRRLQLTLAKQKKHASASPPIRAPREILRGRATPAN